MAVLCIVTAPGLRQHAALYEPRTGLHGQPALCGLTVPMWLSWPKSETVTCAECEIALALWGMARRAMGLAREMTGDSGAGGDSGSRRPVTAP